MKLTPLSGSTLRMTRTDRLRPGTPTALVLPGGRRLLTSAEPTIEKDVRDVWLEQPLDKHWTAAFRLVRGGSTSRLRVGEVRIFPIEAGGPPGDWSGSWRGLDAEAPRRGLTKRTIDRARPHLWLREAERNLPQFREIFGMPADPAPKGSDPRGRPRVPDVALARVADQYVHACATSHRPVEIVAQQCGESIVKVRGWIHKARTRGLLTRREQGQTGGQLTPRATEILEQQKRRKQQASKRRTR